MLDVRQSRVALIMQKKVGRYNKGKGKAYMWLMAHVSYEGDACLPWPFARLPEGYGQFGRLGRSYIAHRFMCRMAHGEPPTPQHQAAHDCGKGHEGCINPRHLSWKTPHENLMDCAPAVRRGRNPFGRRTPKPPEQIAEMLALKGVMSQRNIGKKFGIPHSTVHYWLTQKARREARRAA